MNIIIILLTLNTNRFSLPRWSLLFVYYYFFTPKKKGLIQPTPPQQAQQQNNSHSQQSSSNAGGGGWGTDIQEEDDMDADPISMTVVGNGCSIHHNLSNYLITNNVTEIDTHDLVDSTTKFLSLLLLQGQSLDSSMVYHSF